MLRADSLLPGALPRSGGVAGRCTGVEVLAAGLVEPPALAAGCTTRRGGRFVTCLDKSFLAAASGKSRPGAGADRGATAACGGDTASGRSRKTKPAAIDTRKAVAATNAAICGRRSALSVRSAVDSWGAAGAASSSAAVSPRVSGRGSSLTARGGTGRGAWRARLYNAASALRRSGRSNLASAAVRSWADANGEPSEFACSAIKRRFVGVGCAVSNS